jgi:glycosyltransferase involved in cell wall biosynthesis
MRGAHVRVLLVNAFHYLRGGVERTYLDESRWLGEAGHEVSHFATRDPRNLFSPTARHFAPAADFSEGAPMGRQATQLPHALWSRPAERAMAGLLREIRPEIAHLHAPSRYLTPSILRPLERARVPVVMTLHDFKPWCTNRILFAHGEPCERCRGGHHWHAFETGCVQESRAKSAVATLEAYAHDALGAYRSVRRWLAPSRFVMEKALVHGVAGDTLRLLPHGVAPAGPGEAAAPAPPAAVPDEPYVFFSGRLSVEKGVRLLPAIAMRLAPTPLLVAGEGPLHGWLEGHAASTPNLRLLGHVDDATLARLRRSAGVVAVPSLFYEHFCYAVAEALMDRRPVVASAIGAIPELVEHEATGLLVPPGDAHAFAEAVRRALQDPAAYTWARAGHERVTALGEPRRHLEALVGIYRETLEAGPR